MRLFMFFAQQCMAFQTTLSDRSQGAYAIAKPLASLE